MPPQLLALGPGTANGDHLKGRRGEAREDASGRAGRRASERARTLHGLRPAHGFRWRPRSIHLSIWGLSACLPAAEMSNRLAVPSPQVLVLFVSVSTFVFSVQSTGSPTATSWAKEVSKLRLFLGSQIFRHFDSQAAFTGPSTRSTNTPETASTGAAHFYEYSIYPYPGRDGLREKKSPRRSCAGW